MTLLGHDDAWREWRAAIAGGRLHHAWLLAGRRGLGKASFALAAASELVAEPGVQSIPAQSHPDIIVLHPLPDGEAEDAKRAEGKPFKSKRSISVDQVRAMQRRLTTRPTLGNRRAVIFDAADDLERGAFNALLKSLEEPPGGTYFLLVAHRPGRLPATIRSRCRVLRFAELDEADLARVVDFEAPRASPQAKASAIAVAGGSPGAALNFLARDLGATHRLMERIVGEGDADFALRGSLVDEIGARPDRERQLAALETARAVLHHRASAAADERGARVIEAHAAISRLIAQAPTANFDPTALMLEIGGLLASVADPREAVS